jgi:hypothetical protein
VGKRGITKMALTSVVDANIFLEITQDKDFIRVDKQITVQFL